MNVLSIGNSFSQDAQRYLHKIARADEAVINPFNLYISGCPLSTHYRNMLSGERAYKLEMNGESTGFSVSLSEALLNRDWDVVTLQQASRFSPGYETYKPYISSLAEYVRKCVPRARLAIHETWAYEDGSERLLAMGYKNRGEMFSAIKDAYTAAAKDTAADLLIPSGEVFERLVANGAGNIHRDTYHASYGLGRYALGLTWYMSLTGNNIGSISFSDFDEAVSEEEIELAKKSVLEVLNRKG